MLRDKIADYFGNKIDSEYVVNYYESTQHTASYIIMITHVGGMEDMKMHLVFCLPFIKLSMQLIPNISNSYNDIEHNTYEFDISDQDSIDNMLKTMSWIINYCDRGRKQ